MLKYDYVSGSSFSCTVGPCSWKVPSYYRLIQKVRFISIKSSICGYIRVCSSTTAAKEFTFFIDDCEQPTYPKNTDYPPFPLRPLPSLEELKLSHAGIWWPLDIVLIDTDCASLEAQTTAQRPCSPMNITAGIPKFFSLSEFNQTTNENVYIINDTIYRKSLLDFIGMPRSMLPFIFNINISFPVHIQHKLILHEIKRHEEQNTN